MKMFDMTLFWMHIAPSYYWLMYALWLLIWYYMIKSSKVINTPLSSLSGGKNCMLDDLLMYMVLWVVLGWSIWYMLFYNFSHYLNNPLDMFKVWEGWMSFHGWILWVMMAMILFSKKFKMNFYKLADQMALVVPIWLGLWSIWNYLNKELLWFSPYYWPLNMNWSFPSPLLEMFLEWMVLFMILNYLFIKQKNNSILNPFSYLSESGYKNNLKDWQIASLFLILYWIFSIFVEAFFSMPDDFMGYIWWYFTLWEIYSLPMVMIWIYFYMSLGKKN